MLLPSPLHLLPSPSPLHLILLLLIPGTSSLSLKVGAIVESGNEDELWPYHPKETLDVATNRMVADNEISFDLQIDYIEAQCNTKIGLIEATKKITSPRSPSFSISAYFLIPFAHNCFYCVCEPKILVVNV